MGNPVEISCFLIEPTAFYEVFLRRYSLSDTCSSGGSYHDASFSIGTDPNYEVVKRDSIDNLPVTGDYFNHHDGRWPTQCKCGYKFTVYDAWQVAPKQLYRRTDTGELLPLREFPAGAVWRNTWLEDLPRYVGTDGQSWSVRTPGGDWLIDAPANNCTARDDFVHKCWCRHGQAPNFTVDKNGATCSAGAGSIVAGDYHGFFRAGKLVLC